MLLSVPVKAARHIDTSFHWKRAIANFMNRDLNMQPVAWRELLYFHFLGNGTATGEFNRWRYLHRHTQISFNRICLMKLADLANATVKSDDVFSIFIAMASNSDPIFLTNLPSFKCFFYRRNTMFITKLCTKGDIWNLTGAYTPSVLGVRRQTAHDVAVSISCDQGESQTKLQR